MSLNTFDFAFLRLLLEPQLVRVLALAWHEYRFIGLLVVYATLLDSHLYCFRPHFLPLQLNICVADRVAHFDHFQSLGVDLVLHPTYSRGNAVFFFENLRSLEYFDLRHARFYHFFGISLLEMRSMQRYR